MKGRTRRITTPRRGAGGPSEVAWGLGVSRRVSWCFLGGLGLGLLCHGDDKGLSRTDEPLRREAHVVFLPGVCLAKLDG